MLITFSNLLIILDNHAMKSFKIRPFIQKLFEILENKSFSSIIEWNSTNSFIIHNKERFSREILVKFFKTSSFDSFTRQLNKYNFKKKRNQCIFWNNDFNRNSNENLSKIAIKETTQTLKELKEDKMGLSMFNYKTVKILLKITGILEKMSKKAAFHKAPLKVLIFENFKCFEIVKQLQSNEIDVDTVFFYNDFEIKISTLKYDYLVIDIDFFEIYDRISNIESFNIKTKVICTSKQSNPEIEKMVYKLLIKPYDYNQLNSIIK